MQNVLTALLIVLIILFVFHKPICDAVGKARVKLGIDRKKAVKDDTAPESYAGLGGDPENVPGILKYLTEHQDQKATMNNKEEYEATGKNVQQYRKSLEGLTSSRNIEYLDSGTWGQWIQEDELDPSVSKNHKEFTENIQRFYTGASFTTVDEDNRTVASTNFVGLRRPKNVSVGSAVRQMPDVDEDVLKRNKRFLI